MKKTLCFFVLFIVGTMKSNINLPVTNSKVSPQEEVELKNNQTTKQVSNDHSPKRILILINEDFEFIKFLNDQINNQKPIQIKKNITQYFQTKLKSPTVQLCVVYEDIMKRKDTQNLFLEIEKEHIKLAIDYINLINNIFDNLEEEISKELIYDLQKQNKNIFENKGKSKSFLISYLKKICKEYHENLKYRSFINGIDIESPQKKEPCKQDLPKPK